MKIKNKSTALSGLISICLMMILFLLLIGFHALTPISIVALGFLAIGGVIDLYDSSGHAPDGGNYAWLERIDKINGAVVTLGGLVTGIKVTNPGSGYDAVTVVITPAAGDPGVNAAGTAILSGGKILAVTITNPGSGYALPPTISFTPTTTGSGAAATAYVSDGWHRLPSRASHNLKSGRPETDVLDEKQNIFTTKKGPQQGSILFNFQQMDTWSKNFLFKEANDYDWRLFLYNGISRNNFFHSFQIIARVRFPILTDDVKPKDTLDVTATVLNNNTAITITETNLPVASLAQAYDIPANAVYIEQEELIEPTT